MSVILHIVNLVIVILFGVILLTSIHQSVIRQNNILPNAIALNK